jgi:hypothetical protein
MKWLRRFIFIAITLLLPSLSFCANEPTIEISKSVEKHNRLSPTFQYYHMLLKILNAKDYREIKSFYSRGVGIRSEKLPDALQKAKTAATTLITLPNEFVEEHVEGMAAVIKLSNRRFVKQDYSSVKTPGKNVLSVYYQLLIKEEGLWRIDKAQEISNFNESDKSAKEMLPTLLQFTPEEELPTPQQNQKPNQQIQQPNQQPMQQQNQQPIQQPNQQPIQQQIQQPNQQPTQPAQPNLPVQQPPVVPH